MCVIITCQIQLDFIASPFQIPRVKWNRCQLQARLRCSNLPGPSEAVPCSEVCQLGGPTTITNRHCGRRDKRKGSRVGFAAKRTHDSARWAIVSTVVCVHSNRNKNKTEERRTWCGRTDRCVEIPPTLDLRAGGTGGVLLQHGTRTSRDA